MFINNLHKNIQIRADLGYLNRMTATHSWTPIFLKWERNGIMAGISGTLPLSLSIFLFLDI